MVAVERRRLDWDRWERFALLSGVVAVALWVTSFLLTESTDDPGADATPQEALTFFQEETETILISGFIFQLGVLFFIWFLGSLRTRLHVAEGGLGRLGATAFAGGIAFSVFALALPTASMTGALNEDEMGPSTAEALRAIGDIFFIGTQMTGVVLLLATGFVALRTRLLPVWLAVLSLLIAAVLLIPPLAAQGVVLGIPLWVVLVSVTLWLAPEPLDGEPVTPSRA